MKSKNERTPPILWRVFGENARTLSKTITSLLYPHSCHRKYDHSNCLQCQNALSFLLTPLDPNPYLHLLNSCFLVLHHNAPPLPHFSSHNRFSQHQLVATTIEMMMSANQFNYPNLLLTAYDKRNRTSEIVELLSSSPWNLLLKRVGDDVMIYLLKHSSIFLELSHGKHQQVSGPGIVDLVAQHQQSLNTPHGHFKERKRIHDANELFQRSSGTVDCNGSNYIRPCSNSSGDKSSQICFREIATEHDGCLNGKFGSSDKMILKCRKRLRSFGTQCYRKCARLEVNNSSESICSVNDSVGKDRKTVGLQHYVNQENLCEAAELKAAIDNVTYNENSNGQVVSTKQKVLKRRKSSRPFRWERRKKHARLDVQESSDGIKLVKPLCHRKMPPQCSCSLFFQARCFVTEETQINRKPIFYNMEQSSFFLPQNHILFSLRPNAKGSKFLLSSIFDLSDDVNPSASKQCSSIDIIGSNCIYHSLLEMLKTILHRTKRCNHLKFLDKHCVVPSLNQSTLKNSGLEFAGFFSDTEFCGNFNDGDPEQIEATMSYCLKDQVVSFIWAVCRSLIPPSLLGTSSNWRILRRIIAKLIQLRRYENFSLKQCMHKLKTSEFPFLSDKHPFCCLHDRLLKNTSRQSMGMLKRVEKMKYLLLVRWIYWFFSSLVVPLVQANFYVTESQHRKTEVFYYKKYSWKKLMDRTVDGLNGQNYQCLDAAEVYNISSSRSFGFSNLRLLPKAAGIRLLANLKAPSRLPASGIETYRYFKAVNTVLRDLHAVLKGLQIKEPDMLGCSVFDYNDVYKKLCPFVSGLRSGFTKMPDVFVVVSDVSKAFDSIDQDKLLNVMKDVIVNDEYLLQESYQVVKMKNSLWNDRTLSLMDPNISTDFTRCNRFASLQTVLVNQGRRRCITKQKLLFDLYEHVKRNLLVLDKKFYLQGTGIAQGSILSCLLCSLYYGHLERNVVLPFLEKIHEPASAQLPGPYSSDASAAQNSSMEEVTCDPHYMLLRFIDDILFISTSKKQAVEFFSRLQRGFRDYNCYMNKEKFGVSFHVGNVGGLTLSRVCVGEDGIVFLRWSGLLLNSSTLEVQADYTRYWNDNLRSSLTVCWQTEDGHHLKQKLFGFMRPKCHPIFFDSNINSASVVRLNTYQAFLISAMKFHCYVSEISYICKLPPELYSKLIIESLRYMYSLIRKKMSYPHLGSATGSDILPVLQLVAEEVEWLGLKAFIEVLMRKQTRHKELILLLESKLAHSLKNVSPDLVYAVDPIHSSVIWKIKY